MGREDDRSLSSRDHRTRDGVKLLLVDAVDGERADERSKDLRGDVERNLLARESLKIRSFVNHSLLMVVTSELVRDWP